MIINSVMLTIIKEELGRNTKILPKILTKKSEKYDIIIVFDNRLRKNIFVFIKKTSLLFIKKRTA